ncbi:MAG: hypothetical protein EA402_06925 [Planctomycetota bacterium]|nr:MAG: hypothetical protein EA402_06925 [Planctomycetota bacterium]
MWVKLCLIGLLSWLPALLSAHPHMSRAEAQEILDLTLAQLQTLQQRHHGGVPEGSADEAELRRLQLLVAECRFLLGEVKEALALTEAVIERWPEWPDGYSMRRACFQALGRHQEADADAQRYLQLGAGDPLLAMELIRRPVPDDDPAEALRTRTLQLTLAREALRRWPEETALLIEELRLQLILEPAAALERGARMVGRGPDALRLLVLEMLSRELEAEALAEMLRTIDHGWLVAPPEAGNSGERVGLGVIYDSLGLRQWAHQAAAGALVTLAIEERLVESNDPLAVFRLYGIRGDRARALALIDRWEEALNLVESLLEDQHDPLTWMIARIWCLRELGREAQAAEALAEFQAYYADVGMQAPEALPAWP